MRWFIGIMLLLFCFSCGDLGSYYDDYDDDSGSSRSCSAICSDLCSTCFSLSVDKSQCEFYCKSDCGVMGCDYWKYSDSCDEMFSNMCSGNF